MAVAGGFLSLKERVWIAENRAVLLCRAGPVCNALSTTFRHSLFQIHRSCNSVYSALRPIDQMDQCTLDYMILVPSSLFGLKCASTIELWIVISLCFIKPFLRSHCICLLGYWHTEKAYC